MPRTANPARELTEQETIKQGLKDGIYSSDGEDATLAVILDNATSTINQKLKVLKNLQEIRMLANALVNQGIGSDAQKAFVAAYLPRKLRTNGDTEEE